MSRRKLANLRVLVTGASSGIGRELCLQLVREGAQVLATARRQDRLESLTAEVGDRVNRLLTMAGDITDATHRDRLMETVDAKWSGLDLLINNAGAGAIGRFDSSQENRMRRVMEVDFFAPVELTRLALPRLERSQHAAVVLVGSVLAHRAVPRKSEYCAAKFALRGWAESLRCELAPKRIDVIMISPSTTRTEFLDSLIASKNDQSSSSWGSMSAALVAKHTLSAIRAGRRDSILSLGGKLLVWAGRWMPRLTDMALTRMEPYPKDHCNQP